MKNTILVPIDFSEQSMIALEQSYNLAKLSQSSITLLNVIKTKSSFWSIFSDNEKVKFEIKIEQRLRFLAKETEKKTGVEVGTILRKGKVVEQIMLIADYLKPKLIIMGTSQGVHISRKIIGSRALHIIKTSKYPVISVKGKINSNTCENILLPIDATKDSKKKVKIAIELANLFQSKITILTAIEKKNQKNTKQIDLTLSEIKSRIEDEGIACHSEIIDTDGDRSFMAESIVAYANKVHADLIVIMTQRESGITDFFLGSLAQNIIFSTDVPVLTMNPNNNK